MGLQPAMFRLPLGPLFATRLSRRAVARLERRTWMRRLQVVAGDVHAPCGGYGCSACSWTGWTLRAPLARRRTL